MRSPAQIKLNDSFSEPEYLAVFDGDTTTYKHLNVGDTQRLEFYLKTLEYDQRFGDIYLKVLRDPPDTTT